MVSIFLASLDFGGFTPRSQECSPPSSDYSSFTESSARLNVKSACNIGVNRFVELAMSPFPAKLIALVDRFPSEYPADEGNREALDLISGLCKRTKQRVPPSSWLVRRFPCSYFCAIWFQVQQLAPGLYGRERRRRFDCSHVPATIQRGEILTRTLFSSLLFFTWTLFRFVPYHSSI